MTDWYILDENHNPVKSTIEEWSAWITKNPYRKIVGLTIIPHIDFNERVSTVFLGLDHGWARGLHPVLFETMIFGGPEDDFQERYCTYDEAFKGHIEAVKRRLKER